MEVFHRDVPGKISLFRVNEIGKSRIVLRLYSVKGVVSLNTPVVARYEYPIFNLVVVAQRRRRSMWKRQNKQNSPKRLPVLSCMFRSFPLFREFFSQKARGSAKCIWHLPLVTA
jgi:hypothetical protein